MKGRAATRFRPHAPTVREHDRSGDRETKAQALRLRGEERLEEARQLLARDTWPRVAHGYANGLLILAHGRESQSTADSLHGGHRIACVQNEIQQHLLQ